MLGKNPKQTASLKEKGGVKAKLSNGEHKFTPEEKLQIEANGVDLTILAPDAEDTELSLRKALQKMAFQVIRRLA